MRRCTRALTVLALTVLPTGCYSSSPFEWDVSTDTTVDGTTDTHHDPAWDPGLDPGTDPGHDPWPDPSVDTLIDPGIDVPGTCPAPEPPPHGPTVDFIVNGESWPGWVDVHAQCNIDSVFNEDDAVFVTLVCWGPSGEAERYSIEIFSSPYLWVPLWVGQEVVFRYMADPVWWINEYFSIRYPYDGRMIVGGLKSDTLNPPIYEDFWYPLGIWDGMSECPIEYMDCYDVRREGVTVRLDEELYVAFDSTVSWIGPWGQYGVYVDSAVEHLNFRCTDVPGSWYQVLFFESGWD